MGLSRHKDLWGFESASFGTLWSMSLFIICSFYYHMLSKLTPYMFMFLLCINTPVCCMYFASSNINLATYFSQLALVCLKLLLGLTPDPPTPSGPPKLEASIKRAAQPTSWSQHLARLQTQHLCPNSELNILSLSPSLVRSHVEGHGVEMGSRGAVSIQFTQGTDYNGSDSHPARQLATFSDWSGQLGFCNWSCIVSTITRRQQVAPHSIPFQIPFSSRVELQNPRQGDVGNLRALEEWRHFVEGAEHCCDIWMDLKNLQYFMTAKKLNQRQARWSLLLAWFDFIMHHRPVKSMGKMDALSRSQAWRTTTTWSSLLWISLQSKHWKVWRQQERNKGYWRISGREHKMERKRNQWQGLRGNYKVWRLWLAPWSQWSGPYLMDFCISGARSMFQIPPISVVELSCFLTTLGWLVTVEDGRHWS